MHPHNPKNPLAVNFAIIFALLAALALMMAILTAVRHEEWKDDVYEYCDGEKPKSLQAKGVPAEGYRYCFDAVRCSYFPIAQKDFVVQHSEYVRKCRQTAAACDTCLTRS